MVWSAKGSDISGRGCGCNCPGTWRSRATANRRFLPARRSRGLQGETLLQPVPGPARDTGHTSPAAADAFLLDTQPPVQSYCYWPYTCIVTLLLWCLLFRCAAGRLGSDFSRQGALVL